MKILIFAFISFIGIVSAKNASSRYLIDECGCPAMMVDEVCGMDGMTYQNPCRLECKGGVNLDIEKKFRILYPLFSLVEIQMYGKLSM